MKLDHTYLLFGTQILAVIGNLAPFCTRGAAGDPILRAVADVEMLANAITAKLQSKSESVRLAATDWPITLGAPRAVPREQSRQWFAGHRD